MRNDHQDALAAGLSVGEYDPQGKSAEEIRNLWRWTETRLNCDVVEARIDEFASVEFPILLRKRVEIAVQTTAGHAVPTPTGIGARWGAVA
jgi:chromosome partitioning protein